jgi:hypothetical protein
VSPPAEAAIYSASNAKTRKTVNDIFTTRFVAILIRLADVATQRRAGFLGFPLAARERARNKKDSGNFATSR